MATPDLGLRTAYIFDADGRITSTREPTPGRIPALSLIRGPASCAWALRTDVPEEIAAEVTVLARQEPPIADLRTPPLHADRFLELLRGRADPGGPCFEFPDAIGSPLDVVQIDDERPLARHFKGWAPGEIAAGRAPCCAVIEKGDAVSVCFCARSAEAAAEAGVETAAPFRGRGLAPRVTAAWALAIRATGRVPLYSTAWTNDASLAVARKLALIPYASTWGVLT